MNNTSIEYIGIKEFRNNISSYVKKSRNSKKKFVITSNNLPVFEMIPIKKDSIYKESFIKEVNEAIADIKKGNFYTHEELLKALSKK